MLSRSFWSLRSVCQNGFVTLPLELGVLEQLVQLLADLGDALLAQGVETDQALGLRLTTTDARLEGARIQGDPGPASRLARSWSW